MLRVLLVDDEPFILQGLSMMIDWEGEGFEIVGKVQNALDALAVLQKEQPDLVIADIKMPQMTGLELLEKVRRERLSDAYFVMLSGYSDFEYVRTALQNDCLDYMLKPVGKEELLDILGKVRTLHEEVEKKKRDDSLKDKEVFSRNLIPIVLGRYDADNIARVKEYLGECTGCRYICVELDSSRLGGETEAVKRQRQRELYQKCMQALPGQEQRCIFDVFQRGNSYDVGIVYSEELLGEMGLSEADYLEALKSRLTGSVDFPLQITVGNKVENLESLADSGRNVYMAKTFHSFELAEQTQDAQDWNDSDKKMEKTVIDELIHAIAINDKEEIEKKAMLFMQNMAQADERVINMVVNYLMFELIHLASEQDENVNQQEIFRFISESTLGQLSLGSGDAYMVSLLSEYGDYLAQLRGNQSKGILGRVEADMRENFKENLTLKDLSKKYFVNSAYLGQIFKKQYGESFKDYLNRIRIEEAVDLLRKTDLKIYEIAEAVGYKDLDYFINKFISLKGCTPAKYRKQIK